MDVVHLFHGFSLEAKKKDKKNKQKNAYLLSLLFLLDLGSASALPGAGQLPTGAFLIGK